LQLIESEDDPETIAAIADAAANAAKKQPASKSAPKTKKTLTARTNAVPPPVSAPASVGAAPPADDAASAGKPDTDDDGDDDAADEQDTNEVDSKTVPKKRKRRAKGDGSDNKPSKGAAQFSDDLKSKAALAASHFNALLASKDAYGADEVMSALIVRAWRRAWRSVEGDDVKVPALTEKMNGYVRVLLSAACADTHAHTASRLCAHPPEPFRTGGRSRGR
jgi:hypothetical protein